MSAPTLLILPGDGIGPEAMTLRTSAITSGPMPSPGRIRRVGALIWGSRGGLRAGLPGSRFPPDGQAASTCQVDTTRLATVTTAAGLLNRYPSLE